MNVLPGVDHYGDTCDLYLNNMAHAYLLIHHDLLNSVKIDLAFTGLLVYNFS